MFTSYYTTTDAVAGELALVQLVTFCTFSIRCCFSALAAIFSTISIVNMASNVMVIAIHA